MYMKNTKQRGSVGIVLIILVVIAGIGGTYYATRQKQKETVEVTLTPSTAVVEKPTTSNTEPKEEGVAKAPKNSVIVATSSKQSVQAPVSAPAQTTQQIKKSAVSSSKGRFSVNLPDGWSLQEDKALSYPNVSINILPPASSYSSSDLVLSVSHIPRKYNESSYEGNLGRIPTIDEMTQGLIKSQGDNDENFQFVSLQNTTFAGKSAHVINFKYAGDYAIGKYYLVYTSDTIFTISKMVATEKLAEINKVVDSILSSVVLK